MNYDAVLDFWFSEIDQRQWWVKDPGFDREICERFGVLHTSAALCELYEWRASPQGRLAEVIVLDQFSRNIYRDQAEAFAFDGQALCLAQAAVAAEADKGLSAIENSFLYMPYMHSESPYIHEEAVTLYTHNGIENNLKFELKHKAIIDRFGRYPHRNDILGRSSTAEEVAFLQEPGSSF